MKLVENERAKDSGNPAQSALSYRFDIFKGVKDSAGRVQKIKSVGSAQLYEGSKTYSVYIKTFLNDVFYLLPERQGRTKADFLILTREPSRSPGRKYYWNNVGECRLLLGVNKGLLEMAWDMFGAQDIYMNLYPIERGGEAETARAKGAEEVA